MKIKRFQANNMREAIRLVREEQGPDAVILSSRRSGNGVEVVAATDYDAALVQQAQRLAASTSPSAPVASSERDSAPAKWPLVTAQRKATTAAASRKPIAATPPSAPAADPAAAQITQLRREMSGMRRLIEQQMAGNAWQELTRREPERLAALRGLTALGVDEALARQIAESLPGKLSPERARFLPLGLLAKRIPVTPHEPILEGGVWVLAGPTGVGKTTTIAKLAARYAEQHGVRDIALVSTDHYRVGAQEQLHAYGRMLGVPVHGAASGAQLRQVLTRLSDRKLVLIDTAGLSHRDPRLFTQFSELATVRRAVRTALVLSATQQPGDLAEVLRCYQALQPAGCILTKLDEATLLGGALSALIRARLPLAYFTDGQRVPEDCHAARADQLVLRAAQLRRPTPSAAQTAGERHAA